MLTQVPSLSGRGVQLKIALAPSETEPKILRLSYPKLRARRNLELTFRNVPLPVGKPE